MCQKRQASISQYKVYYFRKLSSFTLFLYAGLSVPMNWHWHVRPTIRTYTKTNLDFNMVYGLTCFNMVQLLYFILSSPKNQWRISPQIWNPHKPWSWPLTLMTCLWPLWSIANSTTEGSSFIDGYGLIADWRVVQRSFTQVHYRFIVKSFLSAVNRCFPFV